jgi:DNA anti-recombination protein RmuC
MADVPIGLLETIITLVAGVLFTLVGIIYRRLRKRIAELEATLEGVESQLVEIKNDLNTAFTWMFGQDADPTSSGIAEEIETRFEEAERRRQLLEDRVDAIIDEPHDAEDLDFERDDV